MNLFILALVLVTFEIQAQQPEIQAPPLEVQAPEVLSVSAQQTLAAEFYYENAFKKVATESGNSEHPTCIEQYPGLVSKDIIRVQISLGYYDNHTIVTDPLEETAIRENLLKPCTGRHVLCDFKNYETDSTLFYKKILGPDNKTRYVILRLNSSAVTTVDLQNKTELKDQQELKSTLAKENFLESFKTHDVVFYLGHSRDGGGPDFFPPVLFKNGKVNYPYYRRTTPGLNDMLNYFDGISQSPEIVGLFSCDSNGHFLNHLVQKLPTTKQMILTHKITNKVYASMIYSLNAVLSFQCRETIDQNLEKYDSHMLETTDSYFAM